MNPSRALFKSSKATKYLMQIGQRLPRKISGASVRLAEVLPSDAELMHLGVWAGVAKLAAGFELCNRF
jgi:hypothetical protein